MGSAFCGEGDFGAIRRDGVVVGSAERKGGRDAVAGGEIDGFACFAVAIERDGKQVAAGIALPGIPVAIEEAGDQNGIGFALLRVIDFALIAGVVGSAGRIDVAGYDEIFAVGRDDFAGCFGGEMGDLPGVGAIGIDAPDLGSFAGGAGIEDAFAIGRPARAFGRRR